MIPMNAPPTVGRRLEFEHSTWTRAARLVWNSVRLPALGILVLLEPAVRFVCACGLVLGVATSVLFELSAAGPRFPFLWMLSLSLAFGIILFLYYGLIAWLSR